VKPKEMTMTEKPYVINKMSPAVFFEHQLQEQPKYTWQWCFNGDWFSATFSAINPPCLLHRIAQRLILNIHWRPIKKP
jgi:hypothetical protein